MSNINFEMDERVRKTLISSLRKALFMLLPFVIIGIILATFSARASSRLASLEEDNSTIHSVVSAFESKQKENKKLEEELEEEINSMAGADSYVGNGTIFGEINNLCSVNEVHIKRFSEEPNAKVIESELLIQSIFSLSVEGSEGSVLSMLRDLSQRMTVKVEAIERSEGVTTLTLIFTSVSKE